MRKHALLLVSLLFAACADFGTEADEQGSGKIAGMITEVPSGEPVLNAEIQIRTADGSSVTLGQVINGNYVVGRLSPGNYIVIVDPPNGYELAPGTLNNVPVSIEGDETETVNFQLRVVTTASTSVPPQARN